jgi:hypothetical protein
MGCVKRGRESCKCLSRFWTEKLNGIEGFECVDLRGTTTCLNRIGREGVDLTQLVWGPELGNFEFIRKVRRRLALGPVL